MRPAPPSPAPGRRAVLRWALCATVLGSSGCAVRLEEDAPDVPLVPRRPKLAAEDSLIALLSQTRGLAAALAGASGEPLTSLAPIVARQGDTLHDRLLAAGVPSSLLAGAPTVPPDPAAALAEAAEQAADGSVAARFAGVETSWAVTLMSLLSSRIAAGQWLDDTRPPAPDDVPAAALTPAILQAWQGADYVLGVVAARADETDRTLAGESTAYVHGWLTAGYAALHGQGEPAVLAVPHPGTLDTAQGRRDYVAGAFTGVIEAYGRELRTLAEGDLAAALVEVPSALAGVATWGRAWGVPLTAFPGLA